MSFDAEGDAHDAFARIAAENSQASAGLLVVAFDEDGSMVDQCVPGTRLARASRSKRWTVCRLVGAEVPAKERAAAWGVERSVSSTSAA